MKRTLTLPANLAKAIHFEAYCENETFEDRALEALVSCTAAYFESSVFGFSQADQVKEWLLQPDSQPTKNRHG